MTKLAFCDYHNMVAILEKTEHNTNFHQIVDFLQASHIMYALMVSTTVYVSHIRQFWSTARIKTADGETNILAKINGKQRTISESSIRRHLKLNDEEGISTLPDNELFENLSLMGYNILPNQRFSFQKDETEPPIRGDRYGEAFPTATSLDAGQDKENIPKTFALPHESFPRITSLGGDEGVQEDAPNRGGIDQGEVNVFKGDAEKDSSRSTDKGSESTGDLANVLSFMGAANILASGGLKEVFTTASPQVPPVSSNVSTVIVTASEKDPTAEFLITSRDTTPYTRRPRASREVIMRSTFPIPFSIPSAGKEEKRKGKEIMTKPEKSPKAKIARIHAEEDLRQMINELDRSNVMINKHMAEYEEAENDLTIEEKTELITELINYQKDFARIKKYQAQQQRLASKSERRKFYTSVLRSHAGWKTKDLRGMTFDQLEEKFIPVWESIQDFVPMDSKKESESLKRSGILLEKVKAKRLKTSDVSAQEQQESDNQDEIINLQQWAVLVREETSVNITPSVVKVPICDWKIYKDKLREVYQIFRVGQAPKVYPYFESMLKDFDRDDLVTLWKLVKDRFKTELPKSDLEKCLFWPLKVMFEPVATDLLWQFEAPIKSWKMYKSCKVHCLSMEGMIIYMLDDVEYPFQKTTLKKMLDHKCEEIYLGLILYRVPCAIKGVLSLVALDLGSTRFCRNVEDGVEGCKVRFLMVLFSKDTSGSWKSVAATKDIG
ncbi:hypothetical protein Tco_0052206 [Tanacetum coccineum]